MKLLSAYILRTHTAPFIFGVVLVVFLYIFQFILKYIGELVGKGLSEWLIIQLIALNTAWMLVLAVPIGVLFSTIMAFGGMSASHEVTIIKASGGSLIRMMFPVIIVGIILTLFIFWFNDEVLPEANHRAKVLMSDIKRKKPTFSIEAGQFSTQLEGYTILARGVDSLSGLLRGVTIYDNTKGLTSNIVSADTGIVKFSPDYTKLIINLFNGEIHQLNEGDLDNYRKIDFEKYQIAIKAHGFAFDRTDENLISRGDREMHIRDMQKIVDEAVEQSEQYDAKIQDELNKHIIYLFGKPVKKSMNLDTPIPQYRDTSILAGLKSAGKRISFLRSSISSDLMRKNDYDLSAKQYDVEIQKKYAIPFACFVFIFVGCPLGIITRGGNFGFSAAITLAFYIFYWACLIGGEKFADRGMMSPFLSMWLGNILVGIMGVILTIKVNHETLRLPGARFVKKIIKRKDS